MWHPADLGLLVEKFPRSVGAAGAAEWWRASRVSAFVERTAVSVS